MPSTITHNYFAEDVLEKLDGSIKTKIVNDINIYKVFSNGPDPLFSYIGKKEYSRFGHTMHREKTGLFFKNVITYIKNNDLQDNSQILAYLYGNITHYVLDSAIHPLVYYKTGRYIRGRNDRKQYRGKHSIMELTIDEYMISIRNNMKVHKFKVHDFGIPKIKMSNELKGLIECCSYDTYGIKKIGEIMNKSIKTMRIVYRLFRYDRFGVKKFIYNMLDKITFGKFDVLKITSYKFDYTNYLHYLNLDKDEWFHPVDKEEVLNYSYIELYCIAYKHAIDLINLVNQVLNNEIDIDNIFNLLNKSYLTGKHLDDNRKIQFFSY